MADFQASTYEALGQPVSPEDLELTSFISLDSQTQDYDDVDIFNQHGLTTSSADKLHQPLDVDHVELAGPSHLQQSEDTQHAMNIGHRSAVQRMGTYSVVILATSTASMLLILSFLTFLWTAPHDNSFWRLIIVNGWAGGAVTLTSLLLRTAVDLQAGIAVAMLAATILETGHVLLVDTAQVSRLRAGRAVPIDIMVPYLTAIRHNWPRSLSGFLRILVVLLLVATTVLHQFTSTMLVSDLSLGVLPGTPSNKDLSFDFTYEWRQSHWTWMYPVQNRATDPWLRNPPAFPTFAEYSEPIKAHEHVDETGYLLRAFLPFQDAQSRETISQYSGKALVLDARVSCQAPQLQQLHTEVDGVTSSYVGEFEITHDVPDLLRPASSVPFNCPYVVNGPSSSWSICEPSGSRYGDGKLLSNLRDGGQWLDIAERWSNGSLWFDKSPGAAHLIFNATRQISDESKNSARNISTTSRHGVWTDVSYLSASGSSYFNLSVTLCYPAIWAARLNVNLHSPHNRTEPKASSSDNLFRTAPDLHVQMGEYKHEHEKSTLESRGILSLGPKDSWLPNPVDAAQFSPYNYPDPSRSMIESSFIAEAARTPRTSYLPPRNTSLVWCFDPFATIEHRSPDINLASIFITSLQVTNNSAATALSTIITILASMAYYDQFPSFAETARDVSTTYLQPFLFPHSFRGFTAVLAITFAHYLLVFLIVAAFVTSTRLSTLGDHWQSISQVISPATEDFLKKSSCATDKEVRQGLKAEDRQHELANLQVLAEDDETFGLVARKSHRRYSHDVGLE